MKANRRDGEKGRAGEIASESEREASRQLWDVRCRMYDVRYGKQQKAIERQSH